MGHKEIANLLIGHGADARVHPVTKYSPLYIACYNGHKEIVELLLKVRVHLLTRLNGWLIPTTIFVF